MSSVQIGIGHYELMVIIFRHLNHLVNVDDHIQTHLFVDGSDVLVDIKNMACITWCCVWQAMCQVTFLWSPFPSGAVETVPLLDPRRRLPAVIGA